MTGRLAWTGLAIADQLARTNPRGQELAKRMSKTLAGEIADRTLAVMNPQNRGLTLRSLLGRHGFAPLGEPQQQQLVERAALVAWLIATYARK